MAPFKRLARFGVLAVELGVEVPGHPTGRYCSLRVGINRCLESHWQAAHHLLRQLWIEPGKKSHTSGRNFYQMGNTLYTWHGAGIRRKPVSTWVSWAQTMRKEFSM